MNWEALAAPWKGPYWLLFGLVGINRAILSSWVSQRKAWGLGRLAWESGAEAAGAYIGAVFTAGSIFLVYKVLGRNNSTIRNFSEFFRIAAQAAAPYLFAAPLAVITLALASTVQTGSPASWAGFIRGALFLAGFATLYVLLRRRLQLKSEIGVFLMALSPYFFLGLALMAVIGGAVLIVVTVLARILTA